MKVTKSILLVSLLAVTTSAFSDDFISENGVKLTVGDELTNKQLKTKKYQALVWMMNNHLVNKNIAIIYKSPEGL